MINPNNVDEFYVANELTVGARLDTMALVSDYTRNLPGNKCWCTARHNGACI